MTGIECMYIFFGGKVFSNEDLYCANTYRNRYLGASNDPCIAINLHLTNLRFLRILTESFRVVLCWIMTCYRTQTTIRFFFIFAGNVFLNIEIY